LLALHKLTQQETDTRNPPLTTRYSAKTEIQVCLVQNGIVTIAVVNMDGKRI
jgi:hypothetical protein